MFKTGGKKHVHRSVFSLEGGGIKSTSSHAVYMYSSKLPAYIKIEMVITSSQFLHMIFLFICFTVLHVSFCSHHDKVCALILRGMFYVMIAELIHFLFLVCALHFQVDFGHDVFEFVKNSIILFLYVWIF